MKLKRKSTVRHVPIEPVVVSGATEIYFSLEWSNI